MSSRVFRSVRPTPLRREWSLAESARWSALREFELLKLLSRDKAAFAMARRLGFFAGPQQNTGASTGAAAVPRPPQVGAEEDHPPHEPASKRKRGQRERRARQSAANRIRALVLGFLVRRRLDRRRLADLAQATHAGSGVPSLSSSLPQPPPPPAAPPAPVGAAGTSHGSVHPPPLLPPVATGGLVVATHKRGKRAAGAVAGEAGATVPPASKRAIDAASVALVLAPAPPHAVEQVSAAAVHDLRRQLGATEAALLRAKERAERAEFELGVMLSRMQPARHPPGSLFF